MKPAIHFSAVQGVLSKLGTLLIVVVALFGCDRSSINESESALSEYPVIPVPGTGFSIDLAVTPSTNGWYWTWTITNLNPGSAKHGKQQDLSHWILSLGTCVTISDIVSAATSTDGTNWTSFTPTVAQDPSTSSCYIGSTLKFNVGTSGSSPKYYRLEVSGTYPVDNNAVAVFKYGSTCKLTTVPGFGCINSDIQEETAWGEGESFGGSNWAMYFDAPSNQTTTVNLIAGQHFDAGDVTVERSGNNVTVTYTTSDAWSMTYTHLHPSSALSGFPLTSSGNPKVGHFLYKGGLFDPPATSWSKSFNWPENDVLLIGAHAVVQRPI